jgi:hypothetical protein
MMQLNAATYYHQPKVSREERERFDANLRDQAAEKFRLTEKWRGRVDEYRTFLLQAPLAKPA